MSYQKCPLCNGMDKDCSVCEGKKIIHTITGKPPSGNVTSNKRYVYDPVDHDFKPNPMFVEKKGQQNGN